MIHQGQGLPFGLETGDDLGTVHARLDDLRSALAAERFLLFGPVIGGLPPADEYSTPARRATEFSAEKATW
jgi:hypothetical protein